MPPVLIEGGMWMDGLVLSPRLQMVAQLLPTGARVADVGTDHAYLPVWLLKEGGARHVIATDLRPGPLARAQATVHRYGVSAQIDLRLCDGLGGVSQNEVDAVVVAGMGGETIAGILAAAPWTKRCHCVLQPMSKHAALRRWLISNEYCILDECFSCEADTLYIAIAATGGMENPYTEAELHAGRLSVRGQDPLRGMYLDRQIQKTTRALDGVRKSGADSRRAAELARLLDGLHAMKGAACARERNGHAHGNRK